MTKPSNQFVLSAAALAVSTLLAACGGGEAGPPPDVVAPTLAITDNVSATTATGPVTFTFTFSEDVGSSFTAEDIAVTGGTASAFTKVNAVTYTLVVTPAENAAGTINVNVAADKFMDLSSNANAAASTAAQAYDTVVTPPPGGTGTLLISWDEEPPIFTGMGAYGDALPSVDPAPAGGTGKALKILKPATAPVNWGGVFFGAPTVPFTADRKTLTARVYSTRAGAVIRLKVEVAGVDGSGVEVAANEVTGAANTWTTLTWNLAGVDPTKSYNVFAITPDPEVQVSGQSYWIEDITLAPAAGGTGDCASPTCIDFSAPGIGFSPFENPAGTVEIANDPTNAGNKVVKFVKKPADPDYFGTVITGIGSPLLTDSARTVTMLVWSPKVGTNFLLKFEGGTAGAATTEADAVTTKAGEWETLTFTMPNSGTFSTVVVFPNGRSRVSSDTTMYIDDLRFPAVAGGGGGGGGGGFQGGIFASDYVGDLGANTARSTEGGTVGFFLDPRLFDNKAFQDGSVCGTACNPGGVPNFYYGIGKLPPAVTDGYFGAFVSAPGNGSADASGYAKIKLKFWGDAESWEKPNFTAQVDVIVQGPANGACTNPSGRPEITKAVTAQKIGAGSEYIIPKTDFVLTENCGGAYTVNSVWSAVGAVVVRLGGTNLQYVNTVPSTPVSYPTFINMGPISFIN
jgi:hypothetical protein